MLLKVKPVPRPVMDTGLGNTFANRLNVTQISFFKPGYPANDMGRGDRVFHPFQPLPELRGLMNVKHVSTISDTGGRVNYI